jgi:hypothetical protein
MKPETHIKPNPITRRYSFSELSGKRFVNAIKRRNTLMIQINGAMTQNSFFIRQKYV